jgi:hypothetical protein
MTADRFVAAVEHTAELIAKDAEQFPIFELDVRWIRLRRYAFVLYVLILKPGTVYVIAKAHGRRRPAYWRRRLSRP